MTWYVYSLLSAVFFAIYFLIFHKYIHKERPLEYLGVMSILVVLFSFPLLKEVSFSHEPLAWLLMYAISLLLTIFFVCIALSFKHLESSEAVPLMNISLLFVVFFSMILFGEQISLKNLIGILLMVAGSYIVEVGIKLQKLHKVFHRFRQKYLMYTLLATGVSSIIIIIEKLLLNPEILRVPITAVAPDSLYFLTRAGMAVNFILILFYQHNFTRMQHTAKTLILPLIITALLNVAANYSHYLALREGLVSLVAPIAALSTLLVVIIGGELFHEHKLKQKMIAVVLMVLATYLIIG
ncbi:EamA family transporter [Candidatus Woesearchaeota archaeon]|nr:EamA family transporter [Candidatus Woesearchaeota archaeon]